MKKALFGILVVGCLHAQAPVENAYPCRVREDPAPSTENEPIGTVCWNDKLEVREDLDRRACQMGGTVLVRVGGCVIGSGRGAMTGSEYRVYRTGDK